MNIEIVEFSRCPDCSDLLCEKHHAHLYECGCKINEAICLDCNEWTIEPEDHQCSWCGSKNIQMES
jgi:hypothetical protein